MYFIYFKLYHVCPLACHYVLCWDISVSAYYDTNDLIHVIIPLIHDDSRYASIDQTIHFKWQMRFHESLGQCMFVRKASLFYQYLLHCMGAQCPWSSVVGNITHMKMCGRMQTVLVFWLIIFVGHISVKLYTFLMKLHIFYSYIHLYNVCLHGKINYKPDTISSLLFLSKTLLCYWSFV